LGGTSDAVIGGDNKISAGRNLSLKAGDMILVDKPLTNRST
jgi:hypothetical protein